MASLRHFWVKNYPAFDCSSHPISFLRLLTTDDAVVSQEARRLFEGSMEDKRDDAVTIVEDIV